jgi:hypothetical protein
VDFSTIPKQNHNLVLILDYEYGEVIYSFCKFYTSILYFSITGILPVISKDNATALETVKQGALTCSN